MLENGLTYILKSFSGPPSPANILLFNFIKTQEKEGEKEGHRKRRTHTSKNEKSMSIGEVCNIFEPVCFYCEPKAIMLIQMYF